MRIFTLTGVLLFMAVLLNIKTVAQQKANCTEVLQTAEGRYANGDLRGLVENRDFQECYTRSDGYSNAERIRARKLVALVHIYEDEIPQAEEAMVKLLQDDPEHPYDETLDPNEFIYLYNKFRTKPIFRVGGRAGITYSNMNLIDEFGVEDLENNQGSFSPGVGIAIGTYIDYNFWKDVEVSFGVNFSQRSVSYENDLFTKNTDISQSNAIDDYSTTKYSDTYTFIDVPLVLKYNFHLGPSWVVYPYGGVIGNYLLSASRSGSREAVTPPKIDLAKVNLREQLNYTYTFGVGIKRRAKTDYFTLELGVNKGGNNFVDPAGRYQSSDLIFRLAQVDGNMSLDYLSVMFGYQKSIYKPKKLKQHR